MSSSLKILHLCPTALAGAPVHLSSILNKYTRFESRTVLKERFTNPKMTELQWHFDITTPSENHLWEIIDWADILHFHHNRRGIYPVALANKRAVVQFHSQADDYIPGQTLVEYNNRKLVVAQYQPRFYTDAQIVPNLIDIWDPVFMPVAKPADRIRIFYSWASEEPGSWGDKGSKPTLEILERLKAKYGEKIEVCVMTNRPYRDCMMEKQSAHICIDECVTGSYHQQSLEACAVGAVTLNNMDDQTFAFMRTISMTDTHPFIRTNLHELFDRLSFYIENKAALLEKGQASRKWMETYWNPVKLADCYIEMYQNIWRNNRTAP